MINYPQCKINLGLNVIEKRQDGFHNLETIFYPVSLCDILEIIPSDKNSFSLSGISIPGNPFSNLVFKAYELLKKDFNLPPVQIHLHKNIPSGAGLGGGSSDAASTIVMLNKIFSLDLSENKMMNYASCLGSDCAFFIANKPMFATGKGDIFQPVNFSLNEYYIILVKPDISVNTADAYSLIKPERKIISPKEIVKNHVEEWKNKLVNDFEKPVFKKFPKIQSIKEKLYELGALYASMSGSGSAVFGLFKNEIFIENIFPKEYFIWQRKLD